MNSVGPSLVWFRNDLRISDNPALSAAIDRGGPVAALYVLELGGDGGRALGLAALWKLHGALEALREALDKDRKSTRLNSSHSQQSRMPSSA